MTSAFRSIMPTDPELTLTIDPSNTCWGAVQGAPTTGGLRDLKHSILIT